MLAVARTDRVRVVVQVPDRDVPFVDRGDRAIVQVDALPGKKFPAVVSRFADSEDPSDRTMHTEIDLDNSSDLLREGMYGNVTIILEPARKNALTVPSNCLIERNGRGDGAVYVVRDGKIDRRDVQVGKDNGKEVEILKGIAPGDQVVVRYTGSISEGLAVNAEPAAEVKAGARAAGEPESGAKITSAE